MTLLRTPVVSAVFRAVVLAVLVVGAAACGDEGDDAPDVGAADRVDGTTYVVTGVTVGGEPRRMVEGTQIRLSFADGNLGITAGCNSMGGRYTLDGTRLTVEPLAMTEMGCDQERMEQDSWVAGLFEEPVQLNLGTEPGLISGDTVLALTDRREVSPDRPLAGTAWTLDGIGTGGGPDGSISSVPGGIRATLRITDNGRAEVLDGCNQGTGPAVVDQGAGTVDFGARATTKMACQDADEVVEAVNGVLDGLTTYTITEKTLTVINGEDSLVFVAR